VLNVALEDLFAERPIRVAKPADPVMGKLIAIISSSRRQRASVSSDSSRCT